MGTMRFEVPHQLSRDEAKKRVGLLLAYWARKYGVSSAWEGDSARMQGKVMGISLDAKLSVLERSVNGEGTDPGFLLRGQAQKYLAGKFSTYLDPARKVEDLERQPA